MEKERPWCGQSTLGSRTDKQQNRQTDRQRDRAGQCVCVCVCVLCYYLVLVGRVERNLADLLVLLSVAHYVADRHLDTLQQRRLRRVAVALSADRQAATVI